MAHSFFMVSSPHLLTHQQIAPSTLTLNGHGNPTSRTFKQHLLCKELDPLDQAAAGICWGTLNGMPLTPSRDLFARAEFPMSPTCKHHPEKKSGFFNLAKIVILNTTKKGHIGNPVAA